MSAAARVPPEQTPATCESCSETLTPGESGGECIRCGGPLCAFCHTASARCCGCDNDAAVEELERHYAAFTPDAHLEMAYEDRNPSAALSAGLLRSGRLLTHPDEEARPVRLPVIDDTLSPPQTP